MEIDQDAKIDEISSIKRETKNFSLNRTRIFYKFYINFLFENIKTSA